MSNQTYQNMQTYLLKKVKLGLMPLFYSVLLSCALSPLLMAKSVSGQDLEKTVVSVQVNNGNLMQVIQTIEEQSDFLFSYNNQLNPTGIRLSIAAKDASLQEVLESVAKETNLSFLQVNQMIAIRETPAETSEPTEDLLPQTYTGTVYEAISNETLPGVTVLIKGSRSMRLERVVAALAEEGWTGGEVALAAVRRYLQPLFDQPQAAPDVLVLGCTHFPPLAGAIGAVAGEQVRIVDSAVTTAQALAGLLAGSAPDSGRGRGACRFLVTDGEARFARVGPGFLGRAIAADAIERIDL